LLRSNALIAAPILAAYMPVPISFKRTAILFVPAGARFFVLVQVIYYSALGATRQHPCSRSWCSISAASATSPSRISFQSAGANPKARSF
jgi:hypothetical protein